MININKYLILLLNNKIFLCIIFIIISNTIFCTEISLIDIDHNVTEQEYTAYNPNYVPTNEGYRIEIDSRPLHELDSRPIYEIDSNSQENRRYLPYNPNYVPTNEGFRVELEGKKVNTYHQHYYEASTQLGTIHSNDGSGPFGEVGGRYDGPPKVYYPLTLKNPKYIHTPTFFESMKSKLFKGIQKLDRHYENNYERSEMYRQKMDSYYKGLASIKKQGFYSPSDMKFFAKKGYSRAEIKQLYLEGYKVINDRLIKTKRF